MPFQTYFVDAGAGVVHQAIGEISSEDLLLLSHREAYPPALGSRIRYTVLDYTGADFVGVNGTLVREIAGENEIRGLEAAGRLIAVVAPTDHIYGIARMWQMLVEKLNWRIQIVRSREDALKWICQKYPDATLEPVAE